MRSTETYVAVVGQVIQPSDNRPYAVTHCPKFKGSVTVSLTLPNWAEEGFPEPKSRIVIMDVRHTAGGWRAYIARFLRPEEEQEQQKPTVG